MKKHRRRTKPPKVLFLVDTGIIAKMKNKVKHNSGHTEKRPRLGSEERRGLEEKN